MLPGVRGELEEEEEAGEEEGGEGDEQALGGPGTSVGGPTPPKLG